MKATSEADLETAIEGVLLARGYVQHGSKCFDVDCAKHLKERRSALITVAVTGKMAIPAHIQDHLSP
jgi:hypothetical protein